MLLLATIFFLVLSPGMLITLPPTAGSGVFSSQTTSHIAIIVHSALFFLMLRLTHDNVFPFGYLAEAETYVTGQNF